MISSIVFTIAVCLVTQRTCQADDVIELLLNSANINLVAFSHTHQTTTAVFALFSIAIAAAEAESVCHTHQLYRLYEPLT